MNSFLRFLLFVIFLVLSQFAVATEGGVVALISDRTEVLSNVLKTFQSKLNEEVNVVYLEDDVEKVPQVMQSIMSDRPRLIYALGAKAAWFAKAATKKHVDTKVLFAMVINWQHYELIDSQGNVAGISAEIAPGTQLFNLSLLSSSIKRVGIIYSETFSSEVIVNAASAAQLLGFELILRPLQHAREFNVAWRQISNDIDAFWVLADPVLYTLDNVHWLNERCLKEKIICVGQSDNIAKLGVTLSTNLDVANVGIQSAALAKKLLQEQTDFLGKVYDPLGTKITLNENSANKIGIQISAETLSIVNEVVH